MSSENRGNGILDSLQKCMSIGSKRRNTRSLGSDTTHLSNGDRKLVFDILEGILYII